MHPIVFIVVIGFSTNQNLQAANFTIPKSDIIHASSGLILHYLSDYKPSNNIIAFAVSIPMVADMCYLIPIMAMKKIPQCRKPSASRNTSRKSTEEQIYERYIINSDIRSRQKRFITDVISIGIGTAALALSTANTIQMANLRSETNKIANSLSQFEQTTTAHTAQILHLNEGQLKIAHELNYTQAALNKTIDLVNEHAEILKTHESALRTLSSMTLFLSNRLSTFMHAVEAHFIHTSIEDIISNKLNLQFIHHKDLTQVAELIIKNANISFDDTNSILSPVELITRLLVQQRIDFIPTNKSQNNDETDTIGKLIFTSYFAAPVPKQPPFSLYELIAVPFNHGKHRVQLAQMPYVLGIEPTTQQFIRWSKDEADTCNFVQMSTCRETPAIRKDLTDDCLGQILTDAPLTACRIEPHPEPVFVHRVGQHWAISTNTTTKCHPVHFSDLEHYKVIPNKEIILPPVALITTINTTSLTCDHFFLPGTPNQIGPIISIIENTTVQPIQTQLIDLYSKLNNHTNWVKLPYIPQNMQTLIEFISNTPTPPPLATHLIWHTATNTFIVMGLIIASLILIATLFYRTRSGKLNKKNLTITLPSTKTCEELILNNINSKN
jgi:hypothetical protein